MLKVNINSTFNKQIEWDGWITAQFQGGVDVKRRLDIMFLKNGGIRSKVYESEVKELVCWYGKADEKALMAHLEYFKQLSIRFYQLLIELLQTYQYKIKKPSYYQLSKQLGYSGIGGGGVKYHLDKLASLQKNKQLTITYSYKSIVALRKKNNTVRSYF